MTCPYLEYHRTTDDREFETERAFCTAAETFVQPMRADICNNRYGLDHETHCEIYRAATGTDEPESTGANEPTSTERSE